MRRFRRSAPPGTIVGGTHLAQTPRRLPVKPAVPAFGAEAALEGGHTGRFGPGSDAVAYGGEIGERAGLLDNPDAPASSARVVGRRLRPDADARAGEPGPVEELAGVRLAVRRNI